ncbi:MAG: hypothetical protein U9R75_08230 [Candidatus Thermoplasmatota archaeon]|nr:hypothetical protein [Candidatus Thermoplasmatota archaeon]
MTEEIIEEEQQGGGFVSWLKGIFQKNEIEEEEDPKYKRRLLDGRIEKYLDQNMDSYIQEYGIVTGLDLESYEIRYGELTGRVSRMKEYMIDADAHVSAMETEIEEVQKASKKK